MPEIKELHKIHIEITSKSTGGTIRYSHDLKTLLVQALSGRIITPLLNLVVPDCSLTVSLDGERLDISEEDFVEPGK